ncbi:MAG: polysaccharide pyruvyl transferase family protein [Opitutia bacterium]
MRRRDFLASTLLATLAAGCATPGRPPRILLRSSWQTVNIGDIAHTPGVLALLERHLPAAEVTLWPGDVGNGVKDMLQRRFPALRFAQTTAELTEAFARCDFLLHGSGPSLVGTDAVERWVRSTGKPFGVFGITVVEASLPERVVRLLSGARFVYFRDRASLALAKTKGVTSPLMEFGPDGAFAVDLADDARAEALLRRFDLQPGKFLCCLPRYRQTPYWTIPRKKAAFDPAKQAMNDRLKDHDHAPHRAAIERLARETDLKVLLCPEDETQMALGKEMILDRLSPTARARCAWKPDFWLTDEALSVYRRSAGLFGNEMHSPIMAIGNGIPALVCRWETQTTKGLMWRDLGLGDWLFDFDQEAEVARLPAAVLAMAKDPAGARAKAATARAKVAELQRGMVDQVARAAG